MLTPATNDAPAERQPHSPLSRAIAPIDPDRSELEQGFAILREATIMMVDDDPVLVEFLRSTLEEEGYRNIAATEDPCGALDTMRELRPDLLFLDMVMPGMSGLDVLRQVRADRMFDHMPVIVLTASSDPDIKLQALELGAADFLAKPVDSSELVLRLRNTLAAKAYRDRLTYYDAVTGLPNRRMFMDRLDWAYQHNRRAGQRGVLMHVDLDRFMQVHEALGPGACDVLLKQVAERFSSSIRSSDCIGRLSQAGAMPSLSRLGGDEFTVLLPQLDLGEDAAIVARRLIEVLRDQPFQIAGQDVFLSTSIGLAVFPDDGADADSLLKNAGAALREAKEDGRGCYKFYSKEFNARALHRLNVESELRRAIERDELRLHFQPKVDARTERIAGAEVLVRWQHSERGLVGPMEFIPVAEACGLILPLGEWVLEAACLQAQAWREAGLAQIPLSVNVSAEQFRNAGFIDRMSAILHRTGMPTDGLCVELTETVILDKTSATTHAIANLRELGIKLSIDDFGAGYTSLSYLKRLPFGELKIDKSFVDGIESDADSKAIVAAVITLAHNLGLSVVAEGVETTAQHAFLKAKGCDECQGYLFSRPVAADAFAAWLAPQGLRVLRAS